MRQVINTGIIKIDSKAVNDSMFTEIKHGDIYRVGIEAIVWVLKNLKMTNPKFTVRIKSELNNTETVLLKFIDKDKDGEDSNEW